MRLEKIRAEIDAIDHEILRALHRRMELGLRTKRFKETVRDADREREILDRLTRNSGSSRILRDGFVRGLFASVMDESRKIQEGDRTLVGFQGEHGAFGEAAALAYGPGLTPLPCPGFADVFDGLQKGSLDLGIVPVENSLGGAIADVNELLIRSDLKIVGAVKLRIRHCLLQHPGSDYREMRTAYSHPQALAQCRRFLVRHKLEPRPYYDTAGAARMLAEERPQMAGAVASRLCADIYNLDIVKENIEDHPDNYTRFLVLAKSEARPAGGKCSIVFSTPHEAGSLGAILNLFSAAGVNLTRIESMASPASPGDYVFFLDFLNDGDSARTGSLLDEVRKRAKTMKFLGCYDEATG
ncbi:MAG TPA: bifunctional chorismate mutase/prephenate dehydratase [Candidatus Aminicenantes bacterium]|nr:bifunctional chorismate mutase/prephenate dehydratase [Candidatus Aminicenantes bacterium]